MIMYELAQKLKENGFPWKKRLLVTGECCDCSFSSNDKDIVLFHRDENSCGYRPTLEELIEAVGFCFTSLQQEHNDRTPEGYLKFSGWKAIAIDCATSWVGKGLTPEIAVAELWLNIKNNVYEYHEPFMQGIKFNEKP